VDLSIETRASQDREAQVAGSFFQPSPPAVGRGRKHVDRGWIAADPCSWANQCSDGIARSIGRSPYCRIQAGHQLQGPPQLSSADAQATSEPTQKAKGANIGWDQMAEASSEKQARVDTKPRCAPGKRGAAQGCGADTPLGRLRACLIAAVLQAE